MNEVVDFEETESLNEDIFDCELYLSRCRD